MAEARNHHYVPQCYLRMFGTKDTLKQRKRGKQVQIWVTDLECGKQYKSGVRNIASRRDFNRLNNGLGSPNQVEDAYAAFEDELASTLRAIAQDPISLNADMKSTLFTFFSILAVRHPVRRKDFLGKMISHWRQLAKHAKNVQEFDLLLKREGYSANGFFEDTAFELLKGDEDLEFDAEPDALVQRETDLIPVAFNSLKTRTWSIVEATNESEFITADDPFRLWPTSREKHDEGAAAINDKDTIIFIPLGPTKGIVGEWGTSTATVRIDEKQVAQYNTIMMKRDGKVFSRSQHFSYLGLGNSICSSEQIVATSK